MVKTTSIYNKNLIVKEMKDQLELIEYSVNKLNLDHNLEGNREIRTAQIRRSFAKYYRMKDLLFLCPVFKAS
jgi:hypothetical protein